MARKPTGKPNGRPKKEITAASFEKLCSLQCTKEDIADVFECSVDTIENFCHEEYGESFSAVYKKYSATGRASLRRNQFKLSEKSAAMAIWLGKQYLGQRDRDIADAMDRSNGVLESLLELRNGKDNVE